MYILSVCARSETVVLEGQKNEGLQWCCDNFRAVGIWGLDLGPGVTS